MGKKILLADDSITIQKVIELTFSDEDFEVVTVGNGRLAVDRVVEIRPDIVLCDIIMPEKDGYEVCDFIKRHPQLSNVPVLLLTGAFEPFDQERAARVQCDGFLAKPFEPETLIAKVKDLLQKAAARGSSVTGPRMAVQMPVPAPPPVVPAPVLPPAPPPVMAAPAPKPVEVSALPVAVPEPLPVRDPIPPPPLPEPPPIAEEVRFIPDEPFDDLESAGFGPPLASPPSVAEPDPEPTIPPLPMEPEPYSPEPYTEVSDLEASPEELLHMTAEEAESLAPPASEDSSSTVVFRPDAIPWAQQPTVEVPLEARAQASVESAQAAAGSLVEEAPAEEATVFEEVLEEEVESLVGAEPPIDALPEPYLAPAPPPPVEVSPPPAVPTPPVAAPTPPVEAQSPPIPEPEVEEAAPEPVVPALAHEPPVPSVAAEEPSAIESFVGVAPVEEAAPTPSLSAEIAVPNDMVAQIAQRVVAQISEKVVRQIAWEVIPDLAEGLIKKEIERLTAELQQT
ncbi:MAG TPA: response regulator [Vicinamibacteria bacterium]